MNSITKTIFIIISAMLAAAAIVYLFKVVKNKSSSLKQTYAIGSFLFFALAISTLSISLSSPKYVEQQNNDEISSVPSFEENKTKDYSYTGSSANKSNNAYTSNHTTSLNTNETTIGSKYNTGKPDGNVRDRDYDGDTDEKDWETGWQDLIDDKMYENEMYNDYNW